MVFHPKSVPRNENVCEFKSVLIPCDIRKQKLALLKFWFYLCPYKWMVKLKPLDLFLLRLNKFVFPTSFKEIIYTKTLPLTLM